MTMRRAQLIGVDFTSAPRPAKPITLAVGHLEANRFVLDRLQSLPDWSAFELALRAPGPWVGGFDFPFGLPRSAIAELGWPQDWAALVRHCTSLGRVRFRAALDAHRQARPVGNRYAHRRTDGPARSHSPLKLVNPPVGLMFLEGAPRLLAADVTIPGMRNGDAGRVALEAYPGFAVRTITTESYKSDERAKQTPARRRVRGGIVATLTSSGGPFGCVLVGAKLRSLVDDASGDRLDAVVAAMQAAWAWRRRSRNYGLPSDVDPLEGWIVGVPSSAPA
jgi:Protein of unknown function (DUF429)